MVKASGKTFPWGETITKVSGRAIYISCSRAFMASAVCFNFSKLFLPTEGMSKGGWGAMAAKTSIGCYFSGQGTAASLLENSDPDFVGTPPARPLLKPGKLAGASSDNPSCLGRL